MLQEVGPHRTRQSSSVALAVPDERAVLDALSEVVLAFTNEHQLDPVLDRLLGTTLHVVRADAGSIMLLSRERDTLVVVAARGPRLQRKRDLLRRDELAAGHDDHLERSVGALRRAAQLPGERGQREAG